MRARVAASRELHNTITHTLIMRYNSKLYTAHTVLPLGSVHHVSPVAEML